MLTECKRYLREHFGRPYRAVQGAYYAARRVLETRVLGSRLNAWVWRFKDLWDRRMPSEYICSAAHPHRGMVVEAMARHCPFRSLLEVGCNAGPNLYRLAREFPDAELHGFDLNEAAVERGRAWLEAEGIGNVALSVEDVGWLSSLQAGAYDVVLADAVLMYLGPDRIRDVVADMARVARRSVIILDWNVEGCSPVGEYYDGKWKRDYVALLREVAPGKEIRITKISSEVWAGDWGEMGYIVDLVLC
ncbi:MAG: methyltransferase domain-containing protein [Planctomycetes bacterium]|nr:methyltransferase domain-containing protein [Planctomycetota bacterium]